MTNNLLCGWLLLCSGSRRFVRHIRQIRVLGAFAIMPALINTAHAQAPNLADAVSRYEKGDSSEELERLLTTFADSANSDKQERQKSLFYLGRLHHRKHDLYGDKSNLEAAHKNYLSAFKMPGLQNTTWAANSNFYDGIYQLQRGNRRAAIEHFEKVNPANSGDGSGSNAKSGMRFTVDQLVWTPNRSFSVNGTFSSADFITEFVSKLGSRHSGPRTYSPEEVSKILADMKQFFSSKQANKGTP